MPLRIDWSRFKRDPLLRTILLLLFALVFIALSGLIFSNVDPLNQKVNENPPVPTSVEILPSK